MPTAIEFNNISKEYRLGLVSTRTLSHDMNRWWKTKILRKEDPYLKIGEVNDRAHKGESEYVWALKDINLKVEQGEVLGIIGKNGAGKSTLLKILSRVTSPTTGTIRARGRIASLLEVGTGFHPEMTGRENIYMNGAILGMTKKEIDRKLDEIVDFSGVERYIDTPVKRYSSGMTVRLGFAIAAHLEPEILVVDEVLAVGDAEFQKKAIGKMQDVSKGDGRTVLFVSHNMASLRSLCNYGIVLKDGLIAQDKTHIETAISYYFNSSVNDFEEINIAERKDRKGNQLVKIISLSILNSYNNNEINVDTPITLKIKYTSNLDEFMGNFLISINTETQDCITFLESSIIDNFQKRFKKEGEILVKLSDQFTLIPGKYYLNIAVLVNDEIVDHVQQALVFKVNEGLFFSNGKLPSGNGLCLIKQKWEIINENN